MSLVICRRRRSSNVVQTQVPVYDTNIKIRTRTQTSLALLTFSVICQFAYDMFAARNRILV